MPYTFTICYKPGFLNCEDYLSRSNPTPSNSTVRRMAEQCMNFVYTNALPVYLSVPAIQQVQNQDPVLFKVRGNLLQDFFLRDNTTLKYFTSHDELSIHNEIIMFRNEIVISASLQTSIIQIAREGDQGIVRRKQRLRLNDW